MANALSDFIGGFQAGNAITDQQRQQRQGNQLRQLAPQVVSGDPQAFAQAAAIDPQSAQQYQESGDAIAKRARGAAKYLQSALQSGNQQQIMAARQTIKPFMDTLKPGSSYPLDMDPNQEAAGLQGFLAQTSYLDQMGGASGVQSTYINRAGQRVAIMRDGSQQLLGEADARTQLRDQPGIDPSLVDLRTGQATPLNSGAKQGTTSQLQAEDGSMMNLREVVGPDGQRYRVQIDGDPNAQSVGMADMASGGMASNVQLPDRAGQPGGITAARPAVSAAEQARLDLAQQANARAGDAERRAQEAADRAAKGTPPSGMRWNAQGTALEPIPGAPAPAGNASEDERKAAGWFGQATRALKNMRDALAEDPSADTPGIIEAYTPIDEVANRSRSPARQRYSNASSSLAEALLRAATGAGVNESEARQKIAEVTPQRGDSDELKAQKMAAAEGYLQDLQARAGRALRPAQGAQGQQPAQASSGRPVVRRGRTPDGRTVVQYSDGTVDYGN